MNKIAAIILLAILIIILMYIISNISQKKETFEVILGDDKLGIINRINLQHFFQFVEYFQTEDMSINQLEFGPERRININSSINRSLIRRIN